MNVEIVSIAIGLIMTLLFTEMFGLAAGGMIVPGYLALSLDRPGCIALTVIAALVTLGIARLVAQFALMYGRRRIALMLIVGFLVGTSLEAAAAWWQGPVDLESERQLSSVVGFIIPGLIALWIDRQGPVETLAPMLTLSVAVRLVLVILGMELMA
jgi:poly-gamma-glutamate biosynthesis protein PgsC/CapC